MGKKKGSSKAVKSFGPAPPPEVVARFGPDPVALSDTEATALADLTARHESYTREQLLRFLRARDFDVDEAGTCGRRACGWRASRSCVCACVCGVGCVWCGARRTRRHSALCT